MTYSTQSKECPAMKANTTGQGALKWDPEHTWACFWFLNASCLFLPFVLNFKIQKGNE